MGILYFVAVIVLIFGFVVFRGAPYVPSHRRFVRQAFKELYKVTAQDVLVDVGSGDGLILREAAERGARAIGYELNPILVVISRLLSRGNPRISTKLADFWLTDIASDATIIYTFAVNRDIEKIAAKIQKFVDKHNRAVWVMTYGAPISSRTAQKTLRAHSLYRFTPLQPDKP